MVAVMATVVVAVVARNVNWNRIKSALPVVVAASSMGLRLSGELSGNRVGEEFCNARLTFTCPLSLVEGDDLFLLSLLSQTPTLERERDSNGLNDGIHDVSCCSLLVSEIVALVVGFEYRRWRLKRRRRRWRRRRSHCLHCRSEMSA